jgi:predicted dehydrogenase
MAEKHYRIAVIGTSIGSKLHVRALRGAGFEVTAMVGQDLERTQQRADHFQVPRATTSVDEVLDSDIDAVVVATPPASHLPLTMKAIAARKHVLCEKPFAVDAAEAREMRDAMADSGLVGQVCHPHRWYAHKAALRDLVQSGDLGNPLQATFIFDHSMIATGLHDLPAWWLDNATGGGWLRNFASHGIDFARFMLGDFAAVSGTVHNDPSRGMRADDGYAFAFRLASGGQGIMTGTCRAWDFCDQVRVTGTQGTAGYEMEDAWVRDADGTRKLSPSDDVVQSLLAGGDPPGLPSERLPEMKGVYGSIHGSDHGYVEQVGLSRAFRNRIDDPTYSHPSVATFDDGLAHMQVISGVEKSSASGGWVDLSEV